MSLGSTVGVVAVAAGVIEEVIALRVDTDHTEHAGGLYIHFPVVRLR